MVNRQSITSLLSESDTRYAVKPPTVPLMKAAAEMVFQNQAVLAVMKDDRLEGLVTRSDLLRHLVEKDGPADPMETLSQVTMKTLAVVDPEVTLDRALTLMDQNRIAYLPVIDRGRLIGVVHERELLRGLLDALQSDCRQLIDYIEHLHHAGLD